MRHLELFAGIGGFRRAIDLVSKDAGFYNTCVGFSEIDANAIKTYKSNFQISSDEVELGDIVAFTADEKNSFHLIGCCGVESPKSEVFSITGGAAKRNRKRRIYGVCSTIYWHMTDSLPMISAR